MHKDLIFSQVKIRRTEKQLTKSSSYTMSERKATDKPSIRSVLKGFSEQTTAHGISQIYTANRWFLRVLWMLIVAGGLSMVLYQCAALIVTYINIPVQTSIDVKYSQTVSFPMVTICNLNMIKASRSRAFPAMRQIFVKYEDLKNSNSTLQSSSFVNSDMKKAMKNVLTTKEKSGSSADALSNVEMDSTNYVQDDIINILAGDSHEKLVEAGHSFEELIFRCSWLGFKCNQGDFLNYWRRTWNWRYGNCYTFNAGSNENGTDLPVLTISKPGPSFGLVLDLFINQAEYLGVLSQEAGVKVLLTDQGKIPFPATHGFTVSPGLSTSVGVRKFVVERIDPFKNTSCYGNLSLENGSIYQDMKGIVYSVQGCMNSCLANKQNQTCNCTEGKFRTKDAKTICRSEAQVQCQLDVNNAYQNGSLGCSERCPPPCDHRSYRFTVSSAQWSEAYERDFQRTITKSSKGFDRKMGSDASIMRKNFLRIKIFFDELNLENIKYSKSYQLENLLGDIGGQLGLWIGVSAITVMEFIKLFVDLMKCLIHKARWRYYQKREVDDIRMT